MYLYTIASLAMVFSIQAQDLRGIDRSSMDRAYYPDNYAHDRTEGEELIAMVTYSRPVKNERQVFGKLVPFGQVWRTGANEATEITFFQDVMFGNDVLEAGTYALFTIPVKDEWTIIFNKDLYYWGAYSYQETQDVLRIKAPTSSLDEPIEAFTIQFGKTDDSVLMYLAWDKTLVTVPFSH